MRIDLRSIPWSHDEKASLLVGLYHRFDKQSPWTLGLVVVRTQNQYNQGKNEQAMTKQVCFRATRFLNTPLQGKSTQLAGKEFMLGDVLIQIADIETISASIRRSVDDGFIRNLSEAGIKFENAGKQVQDEIRTCKKMTCDAIAQVIRMLKFYFINTQISETEVAKVPKWEWSTDEVSWQTLPFSVVMGSVRIRLESCYTFDVYEYAKKALNDERYFSTALHHLHNAMNSSVPRNAYIDAAIAAELAIKEFYAKRVPELEEMLLEVPSPPVHKLYGSLLEHYTRERSPCVTALSHGVTKRNRLVHRPNSEEVTAEESTKYVNYVQLAILHLLTLLYTDDSLLRHEFDELKSQLIPAK